VGAGAAGIHRHGDGHIDHVKFVNGFHAEVGKPHHFGGPDGFGDQVGALLLLTAC